MRRPLLSCVLLLLAASPVRAGPTQGLGLSYDFTSVTSKEQSSYTFHSPALTWTLSGEGPTGWAALLSALVPVQGRQDGEIYASSHYYKRFWGVDGLLGRGYRVPLSNGFELEGSLGVHLNYLSLIGKDGYRDWNSFTGGVGTIVLARWRLGGELFGGPMFLGAFVNLSADFFDLLHGGDLRWALNVATGVQLAVTF